MPRDESRSLAPVWQSVSDKVTVPVLNIGFGQDHITEFENISERCDGLHEHKVLYPQNHVLGNWKRRPDDALQLRFSLFVYLLSSLPLYWLPRDPQ